MTEESTFAPRRREIQQRLQVLDLMVKELVGPGAGRHPMAPEIRNQVIFEIKVEEAKLRGEYFVLREIDGPDRRPQADHPVSV